MTVIRDHGYPPPSSLPQQAIKEVLPPTDGLPVPQVALPRVAALPRIPAGWKVIDWHAKAMALHEWLFEKDSARGVDVFFNVKEHVLACLPSVAFEAVFRACRSQRSEHTWEI